MAHGAGGHIATFNGTSGGPEWTTDAAPTVYDNPTALKFDGIDDSLSLGKVGMVKDGKHLRLLAHEGTISLWFKTSTSEMASLFGVTSKAQHTALEMTLNRTQVSGESHPAWNFYMRDKIHTRHYTRTLPITHTLCDGKWHHMSVSWSNMGPAPNVWLTIDGKPIDPTSWNGGTTGWPYHFEPFDTPLEMGIWNVVQENGEVQRTAPFKGLLDEVRFYQKRLSLEEMQILARRKPKVPQVKSSE